MIDIGISILVVSITAAFILHRCVETNYSQKTENVTRSHWCFDNVIDSIGHSYILYRNHVGILLIQIRKM